MNSPPKQKRRRAKTALRILRLLRKYHVAAINAKLLEGPYWFWEQQRGRFPDQLENEGLRP
jgi:hypothetical protein